MADVESPTIANADLWSHYLRDQWGGWLRPLGTPEIADGTAARVANFLTLVAAGPIAWLYNSNEATYAPVERREGVRAAEEAAA